MKLFKKVLEWEWYKNTNTFRIFMHCLLKANWKETTWHGIQLKPGQFITSLQSLADETHLTGATDKEYKEYNNKKNIYAQSPKSGVDYDQLAKELKDG